MKILHILIGDTVKQNLIHLLDLTDRIAAETENLVMTDKHINVPAADVKQVCLKRWNPIYNRNIFLQLLYAEMPDVVHVHGSWCHANSRCLKWAHQRGFVTFYSPHGGLMMKEIKHKLWKEKVWKLLRYQLYTLHNADYVTASTSKEVEHMGTLGRHSNIKMADENIVELYNKAKTHKIVNEVSMKTLCVLHQQLHGLLHSQPLTHVRMTSREQVQYNMFCTKHHLTETVNSNYQLPTYDEDEACGVIYKMIKKLKTDIANKTATINDVFQLIATINNNDYDEDQLVRSLKREKLYYFTCRIIQIGDELCGIEKGFMPCMPLNDKITVKLKLQIINL